MKQNPKSRDENGKNFHYQCFSILALYRYIRVVAKHYFDFFSNFLFAKQNGWKHKRKLTGATNSTTTNHLPSIVTRLSQSTTSNQLARQPASLSGKTNYFMRMCFLPICLWLWPWLWRLASDCLPTFKVICANSIVVYSKYVSHNYGKDNGNNKKSLFGGIKKSAASKSFSGKEG